MKKTIRVQVPASSGNIGPGFDVLGMALSFGNELKVRVLNSRPGPPLIRVFGEGQRSLPRNNRNVIYKAATAVSRRLKRPLPRMEILCLNRIPLARGLGSSAAAVLSGILAANRLFGNKLSSSEILTIATQFEGHPDNVAPALLGGIQASAQVRGRIVTNPLPVPDLDVVVAIPGFELSTKKARAVLPRKISMKDAVSNLSCVSLLPKAFRGEFGLLKDLLNDRYHEPYRSKLIPGFHDVKRASLKAGALGMTLSGAGPTLLSFVKRSKVSKVASAMHRAFQKKGVQSHIMQLKIEPKGALVR